ncbi:MAG: hypothetical protein E7Z99_04425 [Coriobacteriaceae bacterium]|nr:hypothetical protein [Coriobacteriaceae bacterium]
MATSATGKRAAGLLVAGAIACSMTAGCLPAVPQAYAAEGVITINQRANAEARYTMYQVFVADINDEDIATHVAWSPANKEAVTTFLGKNAGQTGATTSYAAWLAARSKSGDAARDNAQNAAEYISEMIAASADVPETGPIAAKQSSSFAENLAQHLAACGSPSSPETAVAGTPYANAEGYYLAVSSTASIGEGEAGSAPMWIPLGGSMQTIDAKEDAPSLAFHVREDRDGSGWGKAADSCIGQDLPFRIRGSLPADIGAYDSYHDRYAVTLAPGVELAGGTSPVCVSVGGSDVTKLASIEHDDGTLVIDIADLKAVGGIDANDDIEIDFAAHLTGNAAVGEAGNVTTVERTYTADPVTLAERTAPKLAVSNYAYQLQVVKVDKSTGERLSGAKFTVRASDGTAQDKDGLPSAQAPNANTDAESAGLFVQADGSLGGQPHEFASGPDGELAIPAMDEGVYVVRETAAPEGYEPQDTDIVLTIATELDQNEGAIASLSAHVAGGEAASVEGDEATRLLSVSKRSGTVRMQAADDRMLELAGTGLQGNGALFVAAGLLAGAGTTGLAATGRKRREGK